jgi:hypothetical protein
MKPHRVIWAVLLWGDALFLRFGGNDNHTVLLATVGCPTEGPCRYLLDFCRRVRFVPRYLARLAEDRPIPGHPVGRAGPPGGPNVC